MKPHHRFPGLVAGVLAIDLLVLVLTGLFLYQSRQQHEHRAALTTQNLAGTLAVTVSGLIEKVEVGLYAVTQEVERQLAAGTLRGDLLNAYLARQRAQIRDFEGMWVADGEGDLRWGTSLPAGQPVNIADREYFRTLQGTPPTGVAISKPVIGRITQAWSVLIAKRIDHADGSFAGTVLGSLRIEDYFSTLLSPIDIGRQGLISIHYGDHTLLFQHPKSTEASGQPGSMRVAPAAMEQLRTQPDSGSYAVASAEDGIERTTSHQKVPGQPLYVIVAKDRNEYLAPWRREVAIALFLVGIFWLLTVLFLRARTRKLAEQELADEKSLLESIFTGIPEAVAYTDLDRRFLSVNPGFMSLLGYTLEDLKGQSVSRIYELEEEFSRQGELRFNPEAEALTSTAEVAFRRKNGEVFPGELSGGLIRNSRGAPTGYIGVIRDLTERKLAEQARRDSEARFRAFVEQAAMAIGVFNLEGQTLFLNRKFAELLQISRPEEAIGRPAHEFFAPQFQEESLERSRRRLQGLPVPPEYESILQRADGTQFPVRLAIGPVQLGSETASLALLMDISQSRQAEDRLKASEQRFQDFLEYLPVPISISQGVRILHCNQEFIRTFGYTVADTQTLDRWMELAYPDPAYRKATADQLSRDVALAVEADQSTPPREYKITCKDGLQRNVIISGRPVGDQFIATFTDVTPLRRIEESRHFLETQIHHLQRMESIGRLAGGISHDMNNVLAGIMAVSELLRRKGGQDAKQVELILEATRRGRSLLKGLMAFARKEVDAADLFDLNDLVRQEAELLSSTTLKQIKLDLVLTPRLPRLMGSATALSTALMNLCVNAVDAMPEGGTLTLRTTRLDNQMVELIVQDTGQGMPPEVISRAMEPFFTTKPVGKGTGLGLSMVFGTVQAHGGSIHIQSQVGRGTVVQITLPAVPGEGQQPAPASPAANANTAGALRVLLVDDDPLVRQTAPGLFESLGHSVTVAGGGYEALGLVEYGSGWDVVVLDLNMPDLDGLETLERIRRLRPDLPVLVATGYADDRARAHLAALDRVTVLHKPYTAEELQTALAVFS